MERREERMSTRFARMDADNSGGLSRDELKAMQEARLQDASAETRAKRRDHENDEARRAERLQQNMLNEGRAKLN